MKRIPALLILPAIYLAPCPARTQTLQPDTTAQIDKIFAPWNKPDSPGCALGVYKDGLIVYKHGYGMANLNDDVPITPATVFHVASMSKQFTAFSILLLQQQGKLSLDDDVHKYIPELQDFGQPITLRQMMHHTSGLRDQWSLLGLAGWRYSQDLITDADVLSVVTRQKDLNYKPGEKFLYSNTGFTLLAIVVSRVSGMSFREFTSKNIFEPLGMTHTHFRDDHEEIIKHGALGYEQADPGKPFRMNLTNFDTAGATSLHTTVEDLQLWDENFYHPSIGGPAVIEQMLHRDKLNNGRLQDYAAGLEIGTYKGLPTVDHSGGDAGYRSDMTRFPEQHFSASVLCNFADTNPTGLVRKVADIVLARDFKPDAQSPAQAPVKTTDATLSAPIPLTAEQMNAIAGNYWDGKDQYAKVIVKDGKLLLDVDRDDFHELTQFTPAHFHVADESWGNQIDLHFIAADGEKSRRLEKSFAGDRPQLFQAVAPKPLTEAELAEYAGAYVSEEIDPIYRIVVQNRSVILTRLKHNPDPLRPTIPDVFVGDIGKIAFTRDASGHISGFILDADRIQNFRFTRKAN
ncbi:MAG: serine hydrolase domain-containing protein [Terracidiphilus sp.]